ncbi:hypothetical protein SDC9_80797 [bioreactor metagenome]|uniref:Uncharacterized protein n=1 Tax=bioreactor metagenome TaxID=1076179 RepID=A0A644Z000_9ZZZZ
MGGGVGKALGVLGCLHRDTCRGEEFAVCRKAYEGLGVSLKVVGQARRLVVGLCAVKDKGVGGELGRFKDEVPDAIDLF